MSQSVETQRHIGLFGATCIGVGAIVGGGILALAGTAFEETGAGALLAFALNGLIAAVTALSFAELSTAFPQSGGPYVFAKRVLSVGTAFLIGWIVWFASVMAAVLYAVGFAAFAIDGTLAGLAALGIAPPGWAASSLCVTLTAALATLACTYFVARSPAGGGNAMSVAKVVVFLVLIGGGAWAWIGASPAAVGSFRPLLPHGSGGLLSAMGYTFIALQGFDLIAAVAGEIKDPRRTVPRAMFLALGVAMLVYMPLLALVLAVGVPSGSSFAEFVAANPETLIAQAARNFLGTTGFWLVIAAGVLSMLSALLANIYAAARIAQAMGRDRTLPAAIERTHARLGTPVVASIATASIALAILFVVSDVASAGAASSLTFLLAFALVHVLCLVVRKRKPGHAGFRVPGWPWLPLGGALACTGLAIFQGVSVPAAGAVVLGWLLVGGLGYLLLFARGARIQDAVHEVVDTDLLELRGRSPLVLVPIASGANAGALALVGACLSPPRVGRVLLLNIVPPLQPQVPEEFDRDLLHCSSVLRDSLNAAAHAGARTEALATMAYDPWVEIERVARAHRCATLLIGMSELSDAALRGRLERLASNLACNLVVVRIPPGWRPESTRRVLVPIRGAAYGSLRARLLASLRHRAAPEMEVVYLLVLPPTTSAGQRERSERAHAELLRAEASNRSIVRSVLADDVGAAIAEEAKSCDLLLLGLSRVSSTERLFSEMIRKIVASTECAALVISERR